jgi:putative transposase
MSRFRRLSQTVWCCQYHIVWIPKYRLRILEGAIKQEVDICIRAFTEQQGGEIVELNVQPDCDTYFEQIQESQEETLLG